MKKIFKYPVTDFPLTIPAGSKILSVKEQKNKIVIYALVDPEIKDKMKYNILVIGTGHIIDEDMSDYTYLDTVSLYGGDLMFHIFYKLEKYISA